jgi:hypothetical protein
MTIVGAEVQAANGEDVGKVIAVNDSYFTTRKSGLLSDEEYRIPISAILRVSPKNNLPTVWLSIKMEQLRHGYEFGNEKPNSEVVHGTADTSFNVPTEKPLIRYEAAPPAVRDSKVGESNLSSKPEYICDMCTAHFDSADDLQSHRGDAHKAPVGI